MISPDDFFTDSYRAAFGDYDDGLSSGPYSNDFFSAVLDEAGGQLGQFLGGISPLDLQSDFGVYGAGSAPGSYGDPLGLDSSLAGMTERLHRTLAAQGRADLIPPEFRGGNPAAGLRAPDQYRNTRIAQAIIREATRLGLDPEFALWVASVEGGLDDAAANRRNRQGSQAYGPYQLLIGGGLGDEALRRGIDPRDPNTWEAQIRFALEHVARHGWGAWEAVTARGINPYTGTPMGGYAPPRTPAQPQAQARPQAQTGGSPYAYYSTTPASEYVVAFDYDAPYSNQFNPEIPRHRGVDLVVRGAPNGGRGARVGAFHGGTVVAVTSDPNGGQGVIILGDDGLYHRYFHFDAILAQQGQRIERGTPLGILGASGTEGFPHLHYEVARRMNGDPMGQTIDPRPYLRGAF